MQHSMSARGGGGNRGKQPALLSMKSEVEFDSLASYWYSTDEIFNVKPPELTP